MNPFHFFKTYATGKGLAEFEKQLTEFLIHNKLFQYFAHRSDTAMKEASEKILQEAKRAAEQALKSKPSDIPRGKLKP